MLYPGEVGVSVDLDPGDITCSGVTADDTSCTVNIDRDDEYTVSLSLSNDVGSTTPLENMFDCEFSVCIIHVPYFLEYNPGALFPSAKFLPGALNETGL